MRSLKVTWMVDLFIRKMFMMRTWKDRDAHGHSDEDYSNEVGDDHDGEESEPVDVQNDDTAEDDVYVSNNSKTDLDLQHAKRGELVLLGAGIILKEVEFMKQPIYQPTLLLWHSLFLHS